MVVTKLVIPVVDMKVMEAAMKFSQIMVTVQEAMDTVLGMATNRKNNKFTFT